jgi:hypothetical protein
MRICVLLAFLVVSPPLGLSAQEAHKILDQGEIPVTVRKYEAKPWGTGSDPNDGVRHHFRIRNDSERVVVAVKVGVLTYDVFNEFQEVAQGIVVRDLLPGARVRDLLRTYHEDPATFLTGLIYVNKVRFQDGEIWEASADDLDARIVAFEAELQEGARGAKSKATGKTGE